MLIIIVELDLQWVNRSSSLMFIQALYWLSSRYCGWCL